MDAESTSRPSNGMGVSHERPMAGSTVAGWPSNTPGRPGQLPWQQNDGMSKAELMSWRSVNLPPAVYDDGLWPKANTRIAYSSSGGAIVSSSLQKGAGPAREPRDAQPFSGNRLVSNRQYRFSPFIFETGPQAPASARSSESAAVSADPDAVNPPVPPAADNDAMVTRPTGLSYDEPYLRNALSPSAVGDATGGSMVDLTGYKNLAEPPMLDEGHAFTSTYPSYYTETETTTTMNAASTFNPATGYPTTLDMNEPNDGDYEVYGEYSGNVKTLVRLVNDLPEGVTKQTGAQIIRLTMEAMGISMESVLSDAQAVQSQLLDAIRSNIKKIEEYKTVIRKLESEIRFHQGKANELSEIIDLFILSNTSPNMPVIDRSIENNH